MPTKFEVFVQSNRDVYEYVVSAARQLKAKGYSEVGFRVLWESARLFGLYTRTPGEKWALNNNYCPEFQRLIEAQEPDLRGFFRHRTAKCDGEPLEEYGDTLRGDEDDLVSHLFEDCA